MKVLISGMTGLVGSALEKRLENRGHEVVGLSRNPQGKNSIAWEPRGAGVDPAALEGFDAIVHLAGEGIASGRWTSAKKERIRHSRTEGTAKLVEAIQACQNPPRILVSASAIGYYGARPSDETLDESSAPGEGFLPDVCVAWENAAKPAKEKGLRVVNPRIGVVLSAEGGALKKMLLPFQLGMGGKVGDGKQMMSWIALDDLVSLIEFALENDSIEGPVNAVAPNPVDNAEFTKTLGRVLGRPTFIPMPAFAARLAFGELAEDLLISGQNVSSKRIQDLGFEFQYPELEGALRHVLNR